MWYYFTDPSIYSTYKNITSHCHIIARFVAVNVQRYNVYPIGYKERKELRTGEYTSKTFKTLQCSVECARKQKRGACLIKL